MNGDSTAHFDLIVFGDSLSGTGNIATFPPPGLTQQADLYRLLDRRVPIR